MEWQFCSEYLSELRNCDCRLHPPRHLLSSIFCTTLKHANLLSALSPPPDRIGDDGDDDDEKDRDDSRLIRIENVEKVIIVSDWGGGERRRRCVCCRPSSLAHYTPSPSFINLTMFLVSVFTTGQIQVYARVVYSTVITQSPGNTSALLATFATLSSGWYTLTLAYFNGYSIVSRISFLHSGWNFYSFLIAGLVPHHMH